VNLEKNALLKLIKKIIILLGIDQKENEF